MISNTIIFKGNLTIVQVLFLFRYSCKHFNDVKSLNFCVCVVDSLLITTYLGPLCIVTTRKNAVINGRLDVLLTLAANLT